MNKADKLTKRGEGIATAITCPTTKRPFIIIAADKEDLERLLVVRCNIEPEQFTSDKFREVKVRFAKTSKSRLQTI